MAASDDSDDSDDSYASDDSLDDMSYDDMIEEQRKMVEEQKKEIERQAKILEDGYRMTLGPSMARGDYMPSQEEELKTAIRMGRKNNTVDGDRLRRDVYQAFESVFYEPVTTNEKNGDIVMANMVYDNAPVVRFTTVFRDRHGKPKNPAFTSAEGSLGLDKFPAIFNGLYLTLVYNRNRNRRGKQSLSQKRRRMREMTSR